MKSMRNFRSRETNMWKLDNILLADTQVNEEIKGKLKCFYKQTEVQHSTADGIQQKQQ